MFSARVYSLMLGAFIVVSIGDYLTKRWVTEGGAVLLSLAWLCYMTVTGLWFLVMREQVEIGRTGVVWTICGILATVMIGLLVFNESLSHANKLGVFLCILGVILTSL